MLGSAQLVPCNGELVVAIGSPVLAGVLCLVGGSLC